MEPRNYLLVTAAKNEIQRLPLLIESVIAQTLPPALWVLVDDGSDDGTGDLIDSTARHYPWIEVIHREAGPHHGLRYSMALRQGFDYGQVLCAERGLEYGYLGLVDADMVLAPNHFTEMITAFDHNDRLGLACCVFYHIDNNGEMILEPFRSDWPRGGQRLWRRECYEQTGGQPTARSADSVGNVKVKYAGWEAISLHEIQVLTRPSGKTKGLWAHSSYAAESAYYLHYHPLLLLMKLIAFSLRPPFYGGLSFLTAYLKQWLQHAPRSPEPEVRHYYRTQRLKEYRQYLAAHLTGRKADMEIHWRNRASGD